MVAKASDGGVVAQHGGPERQTPDGHRSKPEKLSKKGASAIPFSLRRSEMIETGNFLRNGRLSCVSSRPADVRDPLFGENFLRWLRRLIRFYQSSRHIQSACAIWTRRLTGTPSPFVLMLQFVLDGGPRGRTSGSPPPSTLPLLHPALLLWGTIWAMMMLGLFAALPCLLFQVSGVDEVPYVSP